MATYTRSSSGVVTPDSDDEEESLLGGKRREKVVRLGSVPRQRGLRVTDAR